MKSIPRTSYFVDLTISLNASYRCAAMTSHDKSNANQKIRKVDLLYYTHALRKRGLFENVEMTMHELANEQCQDQALMQIKLGNYIMAMRWYNTAAARTMGHKKSNRYEAKAKECARQAGASYDGGYYAEDWEAVEAVAA